MNLEDKEVVCCDVSFLSALLKCFNSLSRYFNHTLKVHDSKHVT